MAIQKVSGRTQVLMPDTAAPTAAPVAVPVEVGLSDGVNTQIIKGLNAGDKVVVQMTASQSNQFGRSNTRSMFGIPFFGGR
jgi:hypothetical protein